MKLRHPLNGAIYELRDDGLVEVVQGDRSGVFDAAGRWRSGALREADPHLCGWVAGARAGGDESQAS